MDGHFDSVFFADRHNYFQKIYEIREEFLFVRIAVEAEEIFEFLKPFRFPSCQDIYPLDWTFMAVDIL
jgi:hypothetical protein